MKKAVAAELDRAVAVFVADVVRIGPNATTVTLRVRRQWKGKLSDEMSMKTGVEVGRDGGITVNTCDWDYAKTTISLLDEIARGRSSP